MINGISVIWGYAHLYGYACPESKCENKWKQIIAMTTEANKATHTLSDGSFLRPALLTTLLRASNKLLSNTHSCVDKNVIKEKSKIEL